MILNDAKAKYFSKNKTLVQVLIENCPMKDYIFVEICEAYDTNEDKAMDLMCKLPKEQGEFCRLPDGWEFNEAE